MTLKMNRSKAFRYNRGNLRAAMAELTDVPCREDLDQEIYQDHLDDLEYQDHLDAMARMDQDYDAYLDNCPNVEARREAWREFYV